MPFSDLDPDKMQLERSFLLLSAAAEQGQKKQLPARAGWANAWTAGSSCGDGGTPGRAGATTEI